MKNFEGFSLSSTLSRSLSKRNYKTPTPIQEKAIPLALQGHDILGTALAKDLCSKRNNWGYNPNIFRKLSGK